MATEVDERKVMNVLLMLGGVVFSAIIVFFIITAPGNVVGNAYKLFLPIAFLLGLAAPRPAFYVVILCTAYIDLFKRFMVFDLSMQVTDLYFILGIPPMICIGIATGILSSFLLRWRKVGKGDIKLLIIGLFLSAVFGLITVLGGQGAQPLVNNTIYPTLCFSVPILFPSREELMKLFRFVIIVFVPVALWGLKQSFFGLSDFELRYTYSGMTTVSDVLWDVALRPFSTMASEGQLSLAMSYCAVLSFAFPLINSYEKKFQPFVFWLCVALFILFVLAGILSLKRIPMVIWMVAIVAAYFFASRFKTLLFYGLLVAFGFIMVFHGFTIIRAIESSTQEMAKSSGEASILLRTGTFTSRLNAFALLRESSTYSIMGVPFHERTAQQKHIHTWWANFILNYGLLGIIPLLMAFGISMGIVHYQGWRAPPGAWKALYTLLTALLVAILTAISLGSNAFMGFPSNFYIYFTISSILLLLIKDPWQDDKKEVVVKEDALQLDKPLTY